MKEAFPCNSLFRLGGQFVVGVVWDALGNDGDDVAKIVENNAADICRDGIQHAGQFLLVMCMGMHYAHKVV